MDRFAKLAAFDQFQDPQLRVMFEAAQVFAASLNFTDPYCLTLCGTTGTGKSHLAKKVMKQFMDQNRFEVGYDKINGRIVGNSATWVSWRKFCSDAREGDSHRMVQDITDEWFVVIDDLGATRDNTGFVTDLADQIIAGRKGKWTLITANLMLNGIADQMDVRIADRLLRDNSVVIQVNTESYANRL